MFSDGGCLEAAAAIGRRIVADAIWHNGRCAWMGPDQARLERPEYRAVGPDLYRGSAGVGLFLAHLAVATGEVRARRTAIGALRHALDRAAALPPDRRDGFYTGALGIAWAAASAAALLDDEDFAAGAATAAAEVRPPPGGARSSDIMDGAAGAILGRLALGFLESAITDGEALLARATIDDHGWSWPSTDRRHPRHLCGLAHGAAGVGWALAELFAATGDERFRTGAEGAFAYERSWLDPRAGTWPDHRLPGYRRGRPHPFPSPALGTWCHGEAGIALTRLRAAAILGPQEDLFPAVEATRRRVRDALSGDLEDLSLCHGLAGAADVLLFAGDTSDDAVELAEVAIDRHADRGDWPCGTGPATGPGLFLGLAGIGWFLVRLHDDAIPSPLQLSSALDRLPSSA